jgi:hypothetical protein
LIDKIGNVVNADSHCWCYVRDVQRAFLKKIGVGNFKGPNVSFHACRRRRRRRRRR